MYIDLLNMNLQYSYDVLIGYNLKYKKRFYIGFVYIMY